MLLRLLLRFVEARRCLKKSRRVSQTSSDMSCKIHWSQPDKEWLFQCLVENADEIPTNMAGCNSLEVVRKYLSSRSDCYPGSFGCMGFEEEGDLAHSNPEEGRLYDGATIEVLQTSNDLADHHSNESSHDTGITKGNSIPSIGDEWSYFSQLDEYNPESGLSDTLFIPCSLLSTSILIPCQ